MSTPVPAAIFKPETDTSYLVFCPEHGGWHVAEWWTVEDPAGRWVCALDASVDMPLVSHVMPCPADPMDTSGVIQWAVMRQVGVAGTA
jgi:hypothetical protein